MNQDGLVPEPSLSTLQLAWLQEIGLDRHMLARWAVPAAATAPASDNPPAAAVTQPTPAARVLAPSPRPLTSPSPKPDASPKIAAVAPREVPENWTALQEHAEACVACELHHGRSSVVFGSGVLSEPDWMIIGEAPGGSDDRRGLPFQGKPGQLLSAIMASIGIALPEASENAKPTVFCTNVIKCRPLGNRTPSPEEIAACMPYLQQQILRLQPKRILALGQLAAQALSGTDAPLEQLRGQIHHWQGPSGQKIPLIATWHPATLLLRPQHKADVWNDLNLARSAVAG